MVTVDDSPRRGRPASPVVMVDVARAAGVSQKTVSRVVNGEASVSDVVRSRVLATIDELGYRPNGAARALVTRRTHVVGIVAEGSSLHGVTAQVIGIEREARLAGYGVVVVTTDERSTTDVPAAFLRVVELGAEGVVLIEPMLDPHELAAVVGSTPLVSGELAASGLPQQTIVDIDQRSGAGAAVRHLLDLGHETVHHVSGPLRESSARERAAAWRDALARRGALAPELVEGDWTARSGYEGARRLLAGGGVSAVFAGNDQMAMGVLRAVHERGLSVPGDVSVVGFDDVPEAEFQMVPLTTVRQDFDEMSRQSVLALVRAIEGDPAQRPIHVPVELVVRASSGPPPAAGPAAADPAPADPADPADPLRVPPDRTT